MGYRVGRKKEEGAAPRKLPPEIKALLQRAKAFIEVAKDGFLPSSALAQEAHDIRGEIITLLEKKGN